MSYQNTSNVILIYLYIAILNVLYNGFILQTFIKNCCILVILW